MKPKKPRKPRSIFQGSMICCKCNHEAILKLSVDDADLKESKKLHAWLGKAIKYLESK